MFRIKLSPLLITIIYLITGGLWIIISDNILDLSIENPARITQIQTYKGWFFILLTSLFLYYLLISYKKQLVSSKNLIRKSESKFRGIFESDLAGIVITDNNFNILEANSLFWNIIKTSQHNNHKSNLLNQIPESHITAKELTKKELILSGKSSIKEIEILTEDRKSIPILTASVYLRKYEQYVSFILDIREQKKYKRQLDTANSELNTFLYKTSHDIKGPLASVAGLAEIALAETTEEQTKKYLDLILNSTKRLDNTLVNLIDIITIKEIPITQHLTNLTEIAQEAWSYATKQNPSLSPDFQYKLALKTDLIQSMDSSLLKIILKNLFDNAIKYRNPYIEHQFLNVQFSKEENNLLVVIEDNGLGIDAKVQSRIYDMFFRGSMNSQGSGLGLYIVREAMGKLEGTIECLPRNGGGTIFKLTIPLSSQKPLEFIHT
ncbi:MAG: PAS domain-containing sensor histidine kinase [Cytophagaceae bacterium]